MRCKLCDYVHKNTGRHEIWVEKQVCRVCSYILEIFALNNNRLQEYWEKSN